MSTPTTLILGKALARVRNKRDDMKDVRRRRHNKTTKTTTAPAADTRYLQVSSPPRLSNEGSIIPFPQKWSPSPTKGRMDNLVSERYGGRRRGQDRRLLHSWSAAKDAFAALSDDDSNITRSESCIRSISERMVRPPSSMRGTAEEEIVPFATFGSCLEEGGAGNGFIFLDGEDNPSVRILYSTLLEGVDGGVIATEEVASLQSEQSRSLMQQLKPETDALGEAHEECKTEQLEKNLSSREVIIQRKFSGESAISRSRSVVINVLVGNSGGGDGSRDKRETHLPKIYGRDIVGEKGKEFKGNTGTITAGYQTESGGSCGVDIPALPVANGEVLFSTSAVKRRWEIFRMDLPFKCDFGSNVSHVNQNEGRVRGKSPPSPPQEAEDPNTSVANYDGRGIKEIIVKVPMSSTPTRSKPESNA